MEMGQTQRPHRTLHCDNTLHRNSRPNCFSHQSSPPTRNTVLPVLYCHRNQCSPLQRPENRVWKERRMMGFTLCFLAIAWIALLCDESHFGNWLKARFGTHLVMLFLANLYYGHPLQSRQTHKDTANAIPNILSKLTNLWLCGNYTHPLSHCRIETREMKRVGSGRFQRGRFVAFKRGRKELKGVV